MAVVGGLGLSLEPSLGFVESPMWVLPTPI